MLTRTLAHINTDSLPLLWPGADGGPCGVVGGHSLWQHVNYIMATCEFVFVYGQVIKSCAVGHRLQIGPYCPSAWCNARTLESNVAYCSRQRVSSWNIKNESVKNDCKPWGVYVIVYLIIGGSTKHHRGMQSSVWMPSGWEKSEAKMRRNLPEEKWNVAACHLRQRDFLSCRASHEKVQEEPTCFLQPFFSMFRLASLKVSASRLW